MQHVHERIGWFVYSLVAAVAVIFIWGFNVGTKISTIETRTEALEKRTVEADRERIKFWNDAMTKLERIDRQVSALVAEQRVYHEQGRLSRLNR